MNRKDLAKLFKEKKFKVGVEVGVCKGSYSKILCRTNPDLKLYSVDAYKIIYRDWWTNKIKNEGLETLYQGAKKALKPYNCELVRKTSMEAVQDFDYESIDFVYIDGSHEFDYVMCDLIEWGKRVRKGGIISGHDYNNTCPDVKRAVHSYTEVHQAKLHLTDDLTPSYWFKRAW